MFTCWPPAPPDRENRHASSAAGIVTVGPTRTPSSAASPMYPAQAARTNTSTNSSRPLSSVVAIPFDGLSIP